MTNQEVLKQLLHKKTTLSLTEKEKNYVYNLAAKKCQVGDYAAATPLFQVLMTLDTGNALYLKGMASCQQANKDYFGAYCFYNYAYLLDANKNSDCLLYMASCLMNLHELTRARAKLEELLALDNVNSAMHARAKLLIKTIDISLQKEQAEEDKH